MGKLKTLLVLGLLLTGAHGWCGTVGVWQVSPRYVPDTLVKTLDKGGWRVVTLTDTNLADGAALGGLDVLFVPGGWEAYRYAGFRARRNVVKFIAGGKGLLDSFVDTTKRPLFPQVGTTAGSVSGSRVFIVGESDLAKALGESFAIDTNASLMTVQAGTGGESFAAVGTASVGVMGKAYGGRYAFFGGSFTDVEIRDKAKRQIAERQVLLTEEQSKALQEKAMQQGILAETEDIVPPAEETPHIILTDEEKKAQGDTPAQHVLLVCLKWLASAPALSAADRGRSQEEADLDFLRMERRCDWVQNEDLWAGPLSLFPEIHSRLAILLEKRLYVLGELNQALSGKGLGRCQALSNELRQAKAQLDGRYLDARSNEIARIALMKPAELTEDNPFVDSAGVLKRIEATPGKTQAERAAIVALVNQCGSDSPPPDAPLRVALFLHGDSIAERLMPRDLLAGLTDRADKAIAELRSAVAVAEPGPPTSVEDRMRTDLLMAPYYTGTILPKPQRAEYRDQFLSLANVAVLVGKGVENPAPLVEVLTNRIVRYGGAAEVVDAPGPGHTAIVSLGDTQLEGQAEGLPAVPAKEQGYVLFCASAAGKPVVILKGHDQLGLLWAICSLVQLVDWRDGQTTARAATVVDYPRLRRRGVIFAGRELFSLRGGGTLKESDTTRLLEQNRQFTLVCKCNEPVYQHLIDVDCYRHFWKHPDKLPPDAQVEEDIAAMGRSLTPLSISWWGGMRPHAAGASSPAELSRKLCADEESVEGLLYYARTMEKAGGHLSILLDDIRFPIHPYDQERLGTAREADTWIMTNVMARLQKEYPRARLLVCPPFYWGPVGRVSPEYGEPRDPYLRAIGERWQPEIEVFWTGQQVNGMPLGKKEYVEWITGLIKRKPYLWQNSAVTWYRAYFYHYGAEPIATLKDLYWDGFLESIGWYGFNSDFPVRCIANLVSADFQWNPDAYDPKASVKQAASKLIGPSGWGALERFSDALSYYDRFASEKNYGWMIAGPFHDNEGEMMRYAARNVDIMEARLSEAEAAYRELLALNPVAVSNWTGCAHFLGVARAVLRKTQADKSLAPYRKAPAQRALAEAAGDYAPASNDYFLAASDFRKGLLCDVTDDVLDALVDDGKSHPALVLRDVLETDVLQWFRKHETDDTFELRVSARKGPEAGDVAIALNGRDLIGSAPFGGEAPTTIRLPIPAGLLKEGDNVLKIGVKRKTERELGGPEGDAPPLAIQYAVFKRVRARKDAD